MMRPKESMENKAELLKAILRESGLTETVQALIMGVIDKQYKIIDTLEEIVRRNGWREQSVEKRLNELLEKVDPEKAKKLKEGPKCEGQGSVYIPDKSLV